MSLGLKFVSAVVAEKSVSGLLEHGAIEHLFKSTELAPYEFLREFVKQYHAIPTADTIEKHTGVSLVPHEEPSGYYVDLMKFRHIELRVKQGMKKASDFLLPENKDPEEALRVLTDTVMELISEKQSKQVVDFRHAYDLLWNAYKSKFNAPDEYGLQFGWPSFDLMTGGLVRGDVVSMVGRPGIGKTLFMLYAAMHGWKKDGVNDEGQSRMFVSMEMEALPVLQRVAGLYTGMSAGKIKHANFGSEGIKKLKNGLMEVKGYAAPFYVVDGNLAATVEDIWMLARQLKPAAIFVDGAYLVKHPTERDRFRRVAENADLIKKELAAIAPTVASWQFARTASKKSKKKGEKPDLDDIGYSDAIGQVSSVVLGLFQEDTIETVKRKKVEILKGRSGEVGAFEVNWNWENMDFTELSDTDVAELQFL